MPSENRFQEKCLGNGVYVYQDNLGYIVLYASDGVQETNRVVLNASALEAFLRWQLRVAALEWLDAEG